MSSAARPPAHREDSLTAAFTPCRCPEAELLRQVLCGEVPAADTPMWAALVALVEAAAVRRLGVFDPDGRTSFLIAGTDVLAAPTELHRRRYPPCGHVGCWVRNGPSHRIDRAAMARWAATGRTDTEHDPDAGRDAA